MYRKHHEWFYEAECKFIDSKYSLRATGKNNIKTMEDNYSQYTDFIPKGKPPVLAKP